MQASTPICLFVALSVSVVMADDKALIKIMTKDAKVHVGQVIEYADDAIVIETLADGRRVSIDRTNILSKSDSVSDRTAINQIGLAPFMSWRVSQLHASARQAATARVASVTPTLVYLNVGEQDRVKKGDRFKVFRVGEKVIDPNTGEVLGEERSEIGELEVVEVNEKFSKTRLVGDTEVAPAAGDVAEAKLVPFKVAVLPFVDERGQPTASGVVVADRITSALVGRGVPLVKRTLLTEALGKFVIQDTTLFDADTAGRIGKQVGASMVLTGRIAEDRKGAEAFTRLVSVETGDIVAAASGDIDIPKDLPPATVVPRVGGAFSDTLRDEAGWIDVLVKVDPKRDGVLGTWTRDENGAVSNRKQAIHRSGPRLRLPVTLRGSYDLSLVFKRTAGRDAVMCIFPVGDRKGHMFLHGQHADGTWGHNLNGQTMVGQIANGRSYTLQISVDIKGDAADVIVYLDGKELMSKRLAVRDLPRVYGWGVPDVGVPTISLVHAAVQITSARVRTR